MPNIISISNQIGSGGSANVEFISVVPGAIEANPNTVTQIVQTKIAG